MEKILIALASSGSEQTTFNVSLRNLENYSNRLFYIETVPIISPYIDWNREALAEYAVEKNFDYLFYLDTDMVFHPNLLEELHKHQVDVVTTNYVTKDEYFTPRFMAVGFEGEQIKVTKEKEGLEPVLLAPTGTMLIKVDVFRKIEKNWFGTDRIKGLGEDYWFCVRCRDKGIPVYVCNTLSKQVGHKGGWTYTWEDGHRPQRKNIFSKNIKQAQGKKIEF